MNFRVGLRGDTLAALQAGRIEMERRLKESAQVRAHRLIDRFAKQHCWSPEDTQEILGALGLEELEHGDEAEVANKQDHATTGDSDSDTGSDRDGLRRRVDDTVVTDIGTGSTVPSWSGLSSSPESLSSFDNI